jgi:hypothetical protein
MRTVPLRFSSAVAAPRENHPPRSPAPSHSESAGGNKFRQHIELLEQGVVKFAAAVSWKFLMLGGDVQRGN